MNRHIQRRIHLAGAVGALGFTGTFLISCAAVELAGNHTAIHDVRLAILFALPVLVACLVTTGLTGRRLAGRSRAPVVRRKLRRMQLIAAAGLAILIPCAVILGTATAGTSTAFVEATELAAGGLNLSLLALNFRDGRRLTRRRRTQTATTAAVGPRSRPHVVDTML